MAVKNGYPGSIEEIPSGIRTITGVANLDHGHPGPGARGPVDEWWRSAASRTSSARSKASPWTCR